MMQGDFRSIDRGTSGLGLGWQIAFGVCVGILTANAITWGVAELRLRWELDQVSRQVRQQSEGDARALDSAQRAAAAQAQRQREQQAAQQRDQEAMKQAAAQGAERREQAWKRFYRPSAGCGAAGTSVECSNEYIRAKRAFDEQYQPGR